LVALLAVAFAHNRDSSILNIVANAWAGFGAAFGPLVVLGLYWKRMTLAGALAGIIVGAATVLIWIYSPLTIGGEALSDFVYEIVPGVLFSTIAIVGFSLASKKPAESIQELFDEMVTKVRAET
jgi:SSS family solute:Na+ symporter/sodium/proline symporter